MIKMKIALFGGSFDPVHNGHLNIAKELVARELVEQVWFIPCGNHANGKKRIKMLSLAIKNIRNMRVMPIEVNKKNKSYSYETIKWAKDTFPHEFYFVIGADNLKNIRNWRNFEYIKNNVKFIIINRTGFEITDKELIRNSKIVKLEIPFSSTIIRNRIITNEKFERFLPLEVKKFIVDKKLYLK